MILLVYLFDSFLWCGIEGRIAKNELGAGFIQGKDKGESGKD